MAAGKQSLRLAMNCLASSQELVARRLVPQNPHHPARQEHASHKHCEAIKPVSHLFLHGVALSDTENDGREHCEQHCGREVGKFKVHDFFPMAMWYASATVMKFSRPATIKYLVP